MTAPALHPGDADVLEGWWRFCLAHPGALPPGVAPVQCRLVRAVGRGELPHTGSVYVKVMSFPRGRDRLRYALRALPARREAQLLATAHAAGLRVPEVVQARGARRRGVPRLSFLVTRALPACAEPVGPAPLAEAAAALARAGILHPDLNPGNFLAQPGGGIAVLDLQSARKRRGPLPRRARLAMAARLLAEMPALGPDLAQAGVLEASFLPRAERRAEQLRTHELLRRIRRCRVESTEFAVARRWNGVLYRRRDASLAQGEPLHGGRELIRYWVGDRALQVLDGRPPRLLALFRKSWWFPGRHCVYIALPPHESNHDAVLAAEAPALLQGFARYRAMNGSSTLGSKAPSASPEGVR